MTVERTREIGLSTRNNEAAVKASGGGICLWCKEKKTLDQLDFGVIKNETTVVCKCCIDAVVPLDFPITQEEIISYFKHRITRGGKH